MSATRWPPHPQAHGAQARSVASSSVMHSGHSRTCSVQVHCLLRWLCEKLQPPRQGAPHTVHPALWRPPVHPAAPVGLAEAVIRAAHVRSAPHGAAVGLLQCALGPCSLLKAEGEPHGQRSSGLRAAVQNQVTGAERFRSSPLVRHSKLPESKCATYGAGRAQRPWRRKGVLSSLS